MSTKHLSPEELELVAPYGKKEKLWIALGVAFIFAFGVGTGVLVEQTQLGNNEAPLGVNDVATVDIVLNTDNEEIGCDQQSDKSVMTATPQTGGDHVDNSNEHGEPDSNNPDPTSLPPLEGSRPSVGPVVPTPIFPSSDIPALATPDLLESPKPTPILPIVPVTQLSSPLQLSPSQHYPTNTPSLPPSSARSPISNLKPAAPSAIAPTMEVPTNWQSGSDMHGIPTTTPSHAPSPNSVIQSTTTPSAEEMLSREPTTTTARPSDLLTLTKSPTSEPTPRPSTHFPTLQPSLQHATTTTTSPTPQPSDHLATLQPSSTKQPMTQQPSHQPTTRTPTTRTPTAREPTTASPMASLPDNLNDSSSDGGDTYRTIFCAVADVGYNNRERREIREQLLNLPADCEFLIHLGDIKAGTDQCTIEHYDFTRDTMLLADSTPGFIVIGDNEWNDCPNNGQEEALRLWRSRFLQLDKHWNHSFDVRYLDDSFYFYHKHTLFFGLTLVGGRVLDDQEWAERHQKLITFVTSTITNHATNSKVSSVVLMFHAHPRSHHNDFFQPLFAFSGGSSIPFLFLHGDGHKWMYEDNYKGNSNIVRIQLRGGTLEPPLKVVVNNQRQTSTAAKDAFAYDRQLNE